MAIIQTHVIRRPLKMSQYQCRDYWSTVSGYEEFHDIGSLCLGTLTGNSVVIVGSFQGIIRVYSPQDGGFRPDHVILEARLSHPVIQVESVRFQNVVEGERDEIAILHPRKLTVVQIEDLRSSEGNQYSLKTVAEHPLLHTACNMVVGAMGGHSEKDSIAVQSMDGQLSLYSSSGHAFTSFFSDFLLPGPLCYLAWIDAIATVNSLGRLDVFKYRTLGVGRTITSSVELVGGRDLGGRGHKLKPDWSIDLGENAVEMKYLAPQDDVGFLMVLCKHSVVCVRENGTPVFMKRLEMPPCCIWPYRIQPGPEGTFQVQYLVGLYNGNVLVFSNTHLMWSAMLIHPAVSLRTGDIGSCKGCIVSLDELGYLHCSYLGTTPPLLASVSQTGPRDLDYQEVEAEMKQLQKTIKETLNDVPPVNAPRGCELSVRFDISHVTHSIKTAEDGTDHVEHSVEIVLQFSASSVAPLRDIAVSVVTDPSLVVTPHTINFSEIGATPPFPTPVVITCMDVHVPMTTEASIIATYVTGNGSPQVMQEELTLPLSLFCQRSLPSKNANHKITLDTNKAAVSILSMFMDVYQGDEVGEDVPTNACGFRLLPGQEVTVLASRTSERYRIQSDHLEALSLLIQEVVTRLTNHFTGREPKLQVTFSGPLPLSEYFTYIDSHFKSLCDYKNCGDVLEKQAQQFRAIQKRLLTRFKDKTPTSLSHLDTLLDGTYLQLVALGEKSSSLKSDLMLAGNHLGSVTMLMALLINLSVKMNPEEYGLLRGVLSPEVDRAGEQGWEERTDAAITQLLKTSLAKTTKDQNVSAHSLEKIEDTQRLKRHIALFCDKLLKGGRLSSKKQDKTV